MRVLHARPPHLHVRRRWPLHPRCRARQFARARSRVAKSLGLVAAEVAEVAPSDRAARRRRPVKYSYDDYDASIKVRGAVAVFGRCVCGACVCERERVRERVCVMPQPQSTHGHGQTTTSTCTRSSHSGTGLCSSAAYV